MGAPSGVWRVKSGVWRVKSGVWRVKSGVWRVKSGVWRVELKALVCLPCKGRGTAERWRGFD